MKRFQLIIFHLTPYLAAFALLFATMYYGSRPSNEPVLSPIVASFNDSSLTVTSDQVSESYTVADIASSVSLPSAATISDNYITINNLYESTGTISSGDSMMIEKPTILDTSEYTRGVITYVVEEGDTLDSIIAKENIKASKDQVRWSNGLKNDTISPGKILYLPKQFPGIVYLVKEGDTVEKLAERYQSNAEQIIALNDLEDKPLTAGTRVLLPYGVLPNEERPEYVRPRPRPRPSYSYAVDSGNRRGMTEIYNYNYWRDMYYSTSWQNNPGAFGNCTWFAWYWRRNNMPSNYWLPTGRLGNARDWMYSLGGSYYTGREPQYGAVFQSTSGTYGHVGVVVGVEPGVSITIQEMNHAGPNGKFNHVYQSTMSWDDALKYNYIYAHR